MTSPTINTQSTASNNLSTLVHHSDVAKPASTTSNQETVDELGKKVLELGVKETNNKSFKFSEVQDDTHLINFSSVFHICAVNWESKEGRA